MVGIPLVVYLIFFTLKQFNILKSNHHFLQLTSGNKSDYLNLVLIFCCISAFSSVIFFRNGCLCGLSRFVLCSPYFVILMFINQKKLLNVTMIKRVIVFALLAFISLGVFRYGGYIQHFGFHYLGYFIFVGVMALYLFKDTKFKFAYNISLVIILLLNILWTSFLFNMYLCDGWIYT